MDNSVNYPFSIINYQLLTDIELVDKLTIALQVGVLEIIQEASALTYQTDKAALCSEVFLVLLEVFSKVIDAKREQRDLSF